MSGFVDAHLGTAASVFLVLFLCFFGCVCYVMFQMRSVWNRYFTTLLFSLFRISGQACGIAFAALGMSYWKLLIAYLVLSAEGYFALVLASFYLLVDEQRTYFGRSTLGEKNIRLIARKYSAKQLFHMILLVANVLVIAGGTMLAGMSQTEVENNPGKLTTARGLRTTGQVLFLTLSIVALAAVFYNYFIKRLKLKVLIPLMLTTPFIVVRGVFGILAIYVSSMDYFSFENYGETGMKALFTIFDYTLGVSMEFITACLLISTFFIKRRWPQDKVLLVVDESLSDRKASV